jgi:uncharacterized protein involved in exopolysaccharide biosynthesis
MQHNCNSNDEINLLDHWKVIKRRKWLIGTIVLMVTSISIIMTLAMPKYYKAEAVFMPIEMGGGGSSGQFGGIASLMGLGGLDGQSPSQQFMALLKTRTLAEEIINKYDLMTVMFGLNHSASKKVLVTEAAVRALLSYVTFVDDKKTGTVIISAEFKDPKLATDIANGYVEELQKLINENAFTVSKRNRIFIERQLSKNKQDLLGAGKELNEFYKSGKVSSVESKVDVEIAENDYDGTVPSNDKFESHLNTLQKQRDEIKNRMVVKDVPQQVYLQYLTLKRNLLTEINTTLTQHYEMSKIEEAMDEPAFQVLDYARVPETRSKPKRKQMVMMALVSSLFIGTVAAFLVEFFMKRKEGEI